MNGDLQRASTRIGIGQACLRAGLAGLLLAGLQGCAQDGLPVASLQSVNGEVDNGYRVSAGDKLKVTIFDEKSLTGEYGIGDGGTLAMPLIPVIDAHGKTAGQLATLIGAELKSGGYVLSPRVSVEVLEHRPFFILGEVSKPGEYAYASGLTLDQAVAKAGGFTPRANRVTVQIKRQDWPLAKKVRLDGQSLMIAPGDTITVRESFF